MTALCGHVELPNVNWNKCKEAEEGDDFFHHLSYISVFHKQETVSPEQTKIFLSIAVAIYIKSTPDVSGNKSNPQIQRNKN